MARQRAILMICIICAALLRLTSARDLLATQGILSSRQAQALPANSTRPLSIKAGPTVAAAGQAVGFSWRTVVNLDCTATCANAGTRAINGGTLNQGMCGLMYQGVAYYGLWRPSNKKCQFIMNSQSWASSGGYSCACTLPSGGELNWEANSACASAPRSAALDPPACRYSKYNSDGPWTMGWYSSGTAGGTCYALGLSVGPQGQSYVGINGGLGGNYKTQLLCNPQTSPAASCFSETGYDYWGGDIKNYASVSSSQACCNLCSADSSCKAWTWTSSGKICYLKNGVYARYANNIAVSGVPNRLPDYRKCLEITANRPGLVKMALEIASRRQYIDWVDTSSRWAGISKYVCPPSVPATSDCSAFATWLYWAAFGKTSDVMNGASWTAGYTGTQSTYGTWVAGGKGTSYAAAQLGDLVFYGASPHKHVAMYIGGGQVVSFGSDGPVNILNIDYRTDRNCIKSFPKFFV